MQHQDPAPCSACRRRACLFLSSSCPARRRLLSKSTVRRLLRCLLARCDEMAAGRLPEARRLRWLRGSTHAERLSELSDAWEAPLIEMAGGAATRGDTGAVTFKLGAQIHLQTPKRARIATALLIASMSYMPLANSGRGVTLRVPAGRACERPQNLRRTFDNRRTPARER